MSLSRIREAQKGSTAAQVVVRFPHLRSDRPTFPIIPHNALGSANGLKAFRLRRGNGLLEEAAADFRSIARQCGKRRANHAFCAA